MQERFGFLLVTSDPRAGTTGKSESAWDVVRARLKRARWPLFRGTRGRKLITIPGTRLAFYVAGKGEMAGMIVATARVDGAEPHPKATMQADPDANAPAVVLMLSDVTFLVPPVSFRQALPFLSINPSRSGRWGYQRHSRWGYVLQGGARGIIEADWNVLTRGLPP